MIYRELFQYVPETGDLLWKVREKKRGNYNQFAGKAAGSLHSNGYWWVGVCGKQVMAHVIVWEMHNGPIPEGMEVDHINHVRTDNRLINLRLVTSQGNARNRSRLNTNTSGVTGVSYYKPTRKWKATIYVDSKPIHLGFFVDKEEAIAARKAAEVKYGFHINHGNT